MTLSVKLKSQIASSMSPTSEAAKLSPVMATMQPRRNTVERRRARPAGDGVFEVPEISDVMDNQECMRIEQPTTWRTTRRSNHSDAGHGSGTPCANAHALSSKSRQEQALKLGRPTLNEEERTMLHTSNNEQDADEQVMQLTGG